MSRYMLRNSERQAFKTCRWRWAWTYRDGRQAAVAPTALRFGDLIHQALAVYNKPGIKRGAHPAKAFTRIYDAQVAEKKEMGFDVFSDEEWVNARDLGVAMLNGYVERYAAEDAEYEILSTEQTFQLRVLHPAGFVFWVVGTFDGLWRHRKSKRIVYKEYKTAKAISEDGLPMDEQASMYFTYGPKWMRENGILKPKELPSSILYTFLRKAIPDTEKPRDAQGRILNQPTKADLIAAFPKKRLTDKMKLDEMVAAVGGWDVAKLAGQPSQKQPPEFFVRTPIYRDEADRRLQHERILDEAVEIRNARDGAMAIIKNPGPLHMPNCRGCAVREACEVHEAGGDWEPILDFSMIPWDPYAAHELAERR